ncbi:ribonuclease H protein, partial [Trifolium medium]|nr:ribonuclease H protein [Trifolium medium]
MNMQTEMHQHHLQWQKPQFGWLKCNVDVRFHNESSKTSAGWCLRDHRGQYVMAGSSWRQGNCPIIEGEAMAMIEAMKEMEQRGFAHVIFESDSKNVVDVIHSHALEIL